MAKKSRRVRKKGRQVRLSSTQMVLPEGSEAAGSSFATAAARSAPKVSDLREEYRYVIADLKRIGIIAVAMLAVLIVLALVLT
ncbi:MAG: hypothetical protein GWN58_19700 [Anaerolineae bacterium]|nr:hypothetical protein [Anaerolineae bacterium]